MLRTLGVFAVFAFSLLGLFATVGQADQTRITIEPAMTAPVAMDELAKGDSKKHTKDGGEDERGEEEYASSAAQLNALHALDPSALDDVLRLQVAARIR